MATILIINNIKCKDIYFMRKWKEYYENINSYYEWFEETDITETNETSVISYNASDIVVDKEEFWNYCKQQFRSDLLMSKPLYIYMVASEKLTNPNSKVERYKKCWKKISNSFDLSFMQLSNEIEYQVKGKTFYSAIARMEISTLDNLLKIIDFNKNKYSVFISDKDYIKEIENNKKSVIDFLTLNDDGEVDYAKLIDLCNINHDMACRYGTDSIGAEFAIIFNKKDVTNYLKKI